MSILKVARMGHPVLREPARAVQADQIASPAFQKLVDDMIETMREYQGVGLAAPQVHESLRFFVAALGPGGDEDEEHAPPPEALVLINPELRTSGAKVEGWEGCLSIPDLRGIVPRAPEVQVRALDRTGRTIELRASGFGARVIQHEADHLDGVLFLDRMQSFGSLTFLEEYAKFWGSDSVPEE
jgi:peptide deformylase